MIESSLILLLRKFDKQQLKEFSTFLKSPYFNTNKAIIKLFEYIRKQYPVFASEKLRKEYVFKKLFNKFDYNDNYLRVLMSNILKLAEEYLAYKGIQNEPLAKKKYLLDELTTMGAVKHAGKSVNEGLKEISGFAPSHPDDFLAMYNIMFYKKYFESLQFDVKKSSDSPIPSYDEQKYFIYHFLLRTLAYHFYQINQKMIINHEPKLVFLDEIILFLNNYPEYLELPILNITFLRVLLLKDNDIKDYFRLKNSFYGVFEKIDKQDAYNTVSIIVNYCQRNYALTGDELFNKERFEILKFAVENDLNSYDESSGFNGNRFSNIVSFALESDEVIWTENFIRRYSKELNRDKRDFLTALGNAMVSFSKKEFDESIAYLSKLQNPVVITDKYNLKVLQMKLYYEKDYIDQAESSTASFRHLLQSESVLPELTKRSFANFYAFYSKLISLKIKSDKKNAVALSVKIRSVNNVISKKWLIEKANELMKA